MNLRDELRRYLMLEAREYSYGCVMVYLKPKGSSWTNLTKKIKEEDLFDADDYGREKEPHITALYGLHKTVLDEDIKDYISSIEKPTFKISGISKFDAPDNDVLKFDIESEDIKKMNKDLSEFEHTKTHPTFHAHCTIAYLKKGKAKEYIELLKDSTDIELEVDRAVYSKPNDEKINIDFKK